MTWTVHFKRAVELTPQEIDKCKELSYGKEGYMSEDLDEILVNESRWRYRYSRVYLITENDKIIAWSLLQPLYQSPRWTFQCFVDPAYRKQGIGRKLLHLAYMLRRRKLVVYVDDDNEKFFKKHSDIVTEV